MAKVVTQKESPKQKILNKKGMKAEKTPKKEKLKSAAAITPQNVLKGVSKSNVKDAINSAKKAKKPDNNISPNKEMPGKTAVNGDNGTPNKNENDSPNAKLSKTLKRRLRRERKAAEKQEEKKAVGVKALSLPNVNNSLGNLTRSQRKRLRRKKKREEMRRQQVEKKESKKDDYLPLKQGDTKPPCTGKLSRGGKKKLRRARQAEAKKLENKKFNDLEDEIITMNNVDSRNRGPEKDQCKKNADCLDDEEEEEEQQEKSQDQGCDKDQEDEDEKMGDPEDCGTKKKVDCCKKKRSCKKKEPVCDDEDDDCGTKKKVDCCKKKRSCKKKEPPVCDDEDDEDEDDCGTKKKVDCCKKKRSCKKKEPPVCDDEDDEDEDEDEDDDDDDDDDDEEDKEEDDDEDEEDNVPCKKRKKGCAEDSESDDFDGGEEDEEYSDDSDEDFGTRQKESSDDDDDDFENESDFDQPDDDDSDEDVQCHSEGDTKAPSKKCRAKTNCKEDEVQKCKMSSFKAGEELTVFMGNVDFKATEEDVREFVEQVLAPGEIQEIELGKNPQGKPRGFGFLKVTTQEAFQKALKLNGEKLNNREVRMLKSEKRSDSRDSSAFRSNSRGGFRGGFKGRGGGSRGRGGFRGNSRGRGGGGRGGNFNSRRDTHQEKNFKKRPWTSDSNRNFDKPKKQRHSDE